MKILAVDTSSSVAAAAVVDNEKLLGEYILNHKKTHSHKLMPMIKEMLDSLELTPYDIDVFAASNGPGSFTGLRIGVTTIKSMAYAVNKPVIGVCTLDALAYSVSESKNIICPIMDARNGQVYTALYKWDNNMPHSITRYMGVHVSELVELIKGEKQPVIFIGDAVDIHKVYFESKLGDMCKFAPTNLMYRTAWSVAQIAVVKAVNGEQQSCFDMVPYYLRKSQAEREYDNKHAGCSNN